MKKLTLAVSLMFAFVLLLGCQLTASSPAASPVTPTARIAPGVTVVRKQLPPTPTTWPSTTLREAWQATLDKLAQTEVWGGETNIMVADVKMSGAIDERGRARQWDFVVVSADEQKFASIVVKGGHVQAREKRTDAGLHRPFIRIDEYLDTGDVVQKSWEYMDAQGLRTERTRLTSIAIWTSYYQPECEGAFLVSFDSPLTSVCLDPVNGDVVWASESNILQ